MGNGAQKLPNKPMLPETMTQNCQELLKRAKNGPKDSGMALMAYSGLNISLFQKNKSWILLSSFENRFVGSPYQPSSATKRTKQNSNFFFFFGTGY